MSHSFIIMLIDSDPNYVLEAAMAEGYQRKREDPPRYAVTVNIGKRLEPWVVGVKGI